MEQTTTRVAVATNTYTKRFEREQEFVYAHAIYTSDATVGNRQFIIQMLDPSGNIVLDVHAGAVQAASNVYHYSVMPGVYRETSFVDGSIQVPFPAGLIVPGNYSIKVYDDNNVSASDTFVFAYQTKNVS